ncbi:ATP-dependent helicase HepA [Paraburkholderia caffeinilytica]|uniref:ATP-dependent helicase HepA n=1 Tax=Paraburkholderia caffeinilytica TaxID=1761016 RepID=A0ABQ1M776_9BURK|nr:helicase-related protein [Paraburkholderia caffeinilytica]GGC35598.1 ATP-dependent helicase HepA [Paraburkholderia caffeinilytica]CAB3794363.1 RNA polymerase-associated protein RapA [Paraburkholderia caffeinilytica]
MSAIAYAPGSLIRARGREWIVLTGSDPETLRIRPVSGSEEDQTYIHIALETEPVEEATFPRPDPRQRAGHDAALLLRDALLLSLRRGAGPFRGFGQIAVEPRAYQLVPLLMALKLDPVRLLIADDVGIGKTIEAGLIARELLDRGDIERLAVLCPPHLVDQWVGELEARFHIHPVAVTAASANRLEKSLPPSESIFSACPHTVVSLDYIKSERRRAEFLRACPEFVIVDEAHTCAATGPGRHQRYELLKGLTESPTRHLVMLTATPHSGDEAAFFRLLGLLDRDFEKLPETTGAERDNLRERLSRHFVQRRRPDIAEWKEGNLFPRRETKELTYTLTGAWEQFFDAVLDYCAAIVQAAGGDERRQRLNFWGTLALMRCVASSPAAAAQALRTRGSNEEVEDSDALEGRVFDGAVDALLDDDVEPPAGTDDPALKDLIVQAERLAGQSGDPKLKVLTQHLTELIADGFNPVVFCRFIATAHYLGRQLDGKFKNITVAVVTGEQTSTERKEKVDLLGDAERRVLIATDCLSEGVNLQEHFDAVVHYDLSWNPTRHEQREGRVDRFGQERPIVRATLMYGANNPVDGAVLDVILRKAAKIREELGVPVPVPDDGHTLTQVLLKAVLLKRRGGGETSNMKQLQLFDERWEDAANKAKKNRTVFAQRRLKPEDVLPEWHKSLAAVGGREDVQRFTGRALARLGSGLEPLRRGFKAPLDSLPQDVHERLESEGLTGSILIDFAFPPAPRCRSVQRSHPLVSVLAETLLERTLGKSVEEAENDPGMLGRVGCWTSAEVTSRTVVVLLRLRHQLVSQLSGRSSTLLVEEATALGWTGSEAPLVEGVEALALLAPPPSADPPAHVRERAVQQALLQIETRAGELDAFAERRAQALLADHRRVREAADARGSYSVKALLPADVIGLFVLLPRVD